VLRKFLAKGGLASSYISCYSYVPQLTQVRTFAYLMPQIKTLGDFLKQYV